MPRTKQPALSTQDLKDRGWTPAMIRDLLGQHDRERPNELRVGSRNRRVDAPVKLYLEERVVAVEATWHFAQAQEVARARQDSAAQAADTRQARQREQVERYVAAYTPNITPPPNASEMTKLERWRHHLDAFQTWEFSEEADHLLRGLRGKLRREAQNRAYEKHRAAYRAAYGLEVEA